MEDLETVNRGRNNVDSEANSEVNGLFNSGKHLCYCGKGRDLNMCEFQCGMCLAYFHETCITRYSREYIPFMINYQFFCKRCSIEETLAKKQTNFGQMCLTAIANLMWMFPDRKWFSKETEIIPFIEKNWEIMTSLPSRTKNTWHLSIAKDMLNYPSIFVEKMESQNDQAFGLVIDDLSIISPNHERFLALMYGKPITNNVKVQKEAKTKKMKRKHSESYNVEKKSKLEEALHSAPASYPQEHPFNRDGFRYILAEPDPNSLRWETEELKPGAPIPGSLYREHREKIVLLSMNDRASELELEKNRLTVSGYKGYNMIRANYGVNDGSWYFEVKVNAMPDNSAARIGWSQCYASLPAPCGSDKFGYSWRSRKGTKFHDSCGKHYSNEYKEGDVLGFYIEFPNRLSSSNLTQTSYKHLPLIKYKGFLYYEAKDNLAQVKSQLEICKGGQMIMFLNGKSQGVAFQDFYDGIYYPTISLYKNAKVTVNFGPSFDFLPDDLHCKPMCAVVDDNLKK